MFRFPYRRKHMRRWRMKKVESTSTSSSLCIRKEIDEAESKQGGGRRLAGQNQRSRSPSDPHRGGWAGVAGRNVRHMAVINTGGIAGRSVYVSITAEAAALLSACHSLTHSFTQVAALALPRHNSVSSSSRCATSAVTRAAFPLTVQLQKTQI